MNLFVNLLRAFIKEHSHTLLALFYNDNIWELRESCIRHRTLPKESLYYAYLGTFGSWIGLGAEFADVPTFPHGFYGIFISHGAKIGKGVTIFQQVTIGSNTIQDSKGCGSPTVEDNVYIGAGAKIIGKITVGNNVRIGANCIIHKDIPNNSVCILRGLETIEKEQPLNNTWIKVKY